MISIGERTRAIFPAPPSWASRCPVMFPAPAFLKRLVYLDVLRDDLFGCLELSHRARCLVLGAWCLVLLTSVVTHRDHHRSVVTYQQQQCCNIGTNCADPPSNLFPLALDWGEFRRYRLHSARVATENPDSGTTGSRPISTAYPQPSCRHAEPRRATPRALSESSAVPCFKPCALAHQ